MTKPSRNESWTEAERRAASPPGRPIVGGLPVRDEDIEPTRGLHSVAILFRILAGLLGVIIVLRVINAVTSSVDLSYGVLIAEVIRLVIFAGLLWAAGELADLFVKSHCDPRASRILLGRLTSQIGHLSDIEARAGDSGPGQGRGDARH